jgi:TRAP-type uncharacterized transport system fused permease subunit
MKMDFKKFLLMIVMSYSPTLLLAQVISNDNIFSFWFIPTITLILISQMIFTYCYEYKRGF